MITLVHAGMGVFFTILMFPIDIELQESLMSLIKLLTVLLAALFPAFLNAQEAPRVDGQNDASGTTILLNELNSSAYPDMQIFATVLRDSTPVTGLTADDFRVREDEVDQQPLIVEAQLPPLSVVLAVDVSGSMSKRIDETRVAAKTFVSTLSSSDSVQLLSFARQINTPTGMTQDINEVNAAIDDLGARGDTALYDAVLRSVELLSDREGRKAIVLLSDGVDDDGTGQPLSQATVEDALAAAAKVNVPVFVIGLGTGMDEAVLTRIADETGAIYLNAPETNQLGEVYGQIGDQLSGQYAIRYTSNLPADGTARRVDLASLGAQTNKLYTAEGDVAAFEPDEIIAQPPTSEGTSPINPVVRLIVIDDQSGTQIEGAADWLFINVETEELISLKQASNSTTQDIPVGVYDVVAQVGDSSVEDNVTIGEDGGNEIVVQVAISAAPGLRSVDSAPGGSMLEVTWTFEGREGDLVFIRAIDSDNTRYPTSDYERHEVKEGPVAVLVAPAEAGQYEVRYFNPAAGGLLYSKPLEVTEAEVEIQGARTAQRGSPYQVRVKGPNGPDDIVIIIEPSEEDNRYPLSGERNKPFADGGTEDADGYRVFDMIAPNEPGSYEIRYYSRANIAVLARRVLVVR